MAFELWKTFKGIILAYADLALVTFVAQVGFGFVLYYIISVMFGSSPRPKPMHHISNDHTEEVVKDMNEVPMDTTTSQLTVTASPRWDVFLSFCGKDTSRNFISNLYHALDQAEIETFKDDPALPKGENISSSLCNAIRNSKMFVVVISENYADSAWCLDELVEILSYKRTKNQVIPVYYYVDPSDLLHHKGSYGVALDKHKKRHSVNRIENWKSALTEIANLSGYHLKEVANESEADTIKDIVKNVFSQASTKVLHLESYLIGIDLAFEKIYQQLSMESDDVRALGICGMGGIGKTTIAKVFYNKYSHKFDTSCFLDNVKQNSQGGSHLLPLFQQLLIELLRVKDFKVRDGESALRKLKEILNSKKALIVLDDLDQSTYSELLVRICKLFSAGSRVIITARDASLPNQMKLEMSNVDIYMVKHLNYIDSLELFSNHAFKKPKPFKHYATLSDGFVIYAGGLPLALKVLGSSLCGWTDVSFWKAKLEKVQNFPTKDIQNILQLSYDELEDETEKAIFLDIVFFFLGENIDEAIDVFESCGFFPKVPTIDSCNRFQMHNLIQDMGRNVIREKSKHAPGQRLYLEQKEACQALPNLGEMDRIEGLIIDLTMSTNKFCNGEIFERLPNLRLLKLVDVDYIKGNFKVSFHELRYISWHGCPWKHLPSAIHLPKLVFFDMPFSRFETLWKNAKLPRLCHLNLEGCIHLKELPESIGLSTKLYNLNLHDCAKLKRLPKPITRLTTLSSLNVSRCSTLKLLPEQLGDMKGLQILNASYTAIEKLPDSIAQLKKLIHLNLEYCEKLRKLPEQFGNMEGLLKFDASGSAIEQLPDSFSDLLNLVSLSLFCCSNLTSLPISIGQLKCLQEFNLGKCSQLKRLPDQLGKMQCLEWLYASGTAIDEEIPYSILLLPSIQSLYFPHSILNLTPEAIIKTELIEAGNDTKLEKLDLSCNIRVSLPFILSFSSLKSLSLSDECGSLSPTKPFSFSKLFNLEYLSLTNCTSHGSSFPELPLNLELLEVHNHASLEQVPDLSNHKKLYSIYITSCCRLHVLEKLPPHLIHLTVTECAGLQDLPDLSMLRDLITLNVINNGSTLKVSLNESHLQSAFEATLQNREIAEWFNYKNRGSTVSFDVPPNLGDNLLGVAFWVVYNCFSEECSAYYVVITNKTEGTAPSYITKPTRGGRVGEVQSDVTSIEREGGISIKSEDKLVVSFEMGEGFHHRHSTEKLRNPVKMCGAHLILERPWNKFYSFFKILYVPIDLFFKKHM